MFCPKRGSRIRIPKAPWSSGGRAGAERRFFFPTFKVQNLRQIKSFLNSWTIQMMWSTGAEGSMWNNLWFFGNLWFRVLSFCCSWLLTFVFLFLVLRGLCRRFYFSWTACFFSNYLPFPRLSLRFVPFLDSMSLFLTFAIFCVFCKFHCVSLLLIDFAMSCVLCSMVYLLFIFARRPFIIPGSCLFYWISQSKSGKRVQKWPYRIRIWRPVRYCYC